jgi:hypothetical protein
VIDGHIIADCPYAVKYFSSRFLGLVEAHKMSSEKRIFFENQEENIHYGKAEKRKMSACVNAKEVMEKTLLFL